MSSTKLGTAVLAALGDDPAHGLAAKKVGHPKLAHGVLGAWSAVTILPPRGGGVGEADGGGVLGRWSHRFNRPTTPPTDRHAIASPTGRREFYRSPSNM